MKFALVPAALALVFSATAQQGSNQPEGSVSASADRSTAKANSPASEAASNIGEPVYEVGGSIRPPVAIYTPDPEFSRQARRAKFSGNVLIAMVVDSNGKPRDVHVVRGVGMNLDENALKAVKKYRFRPALKDGKPVAVHVNVQVNFKILDRP